MSIICHMQMKGKEGWVMCQVMRAEVEKRGRERVEGEGERRSERGEREERKEKE